MDHRAWGTVIAGALLLGGCVGSSTTERGPVEFGRALLISETEIELQLPTCNGDPDVSVEETGTEVRVRVVATQELGGGDACIDDPRVRLDEPLGSRTLIDTVGGQPVELEEP